MATNQHYPDLVQADANAAAGTGVTPALREYEQKRVMFSWVSHILTNRYGVANLPAMLTKTPIVVPPNPANFQVFSGANDDFTPVAAQNRLKLATVLGALLAQGAWREFVDQLDANHNARTFLDAAGNVILDPNTNQPVPFVFSQLNGAERARYARLVADIAEPLSTHNGHDDLFQTVYYVLFQNGKNGNLAANAPRFIQLQHVWKIGSRLVEDGIENNDPHIQVRVERHLDYVLRGALSGNAAAVEISLPDLETERAYNIEEDNVRAVGAIYFSAMLEEMRLYAVLDTIVDHFLSGMLPLRRGPAGDRLYRWMKDAINRLTEVERRSTYGRVLGLATGGADVLPNREFNDLWVRFLSTASVLRRDFFSTTTKKVSNEQAQKAARDLAVNLSLHGYGMAHFGGVEMQKTIREMLDILSLPEVLQAYGVSDRWQLVERVSALYLGGSVNGVRYRTMADSGAKIIAWLADHTRQLTSGAVTIDFLDSKHDALINSVERWLAVTGTPDTTTAEYAEPVALQSQPLLPNLGLSATTDLSGMVGDTLSQVGLTNNLPGIPQA